MPTKTDQDAPMYVGKDYVVQFTEVDAEDLTTFNEVTYAFATDQYAASPEFTKTESGGGITITGSDNDVAEVTVDGSDTLDLSPGDYYHEIETEDGQGNSQTAAEGEVELRPSQTN